ncbi:MAG: MATE family efflux transporter [Oscillospiraceae bacterium]|nr:MATE family efflux transporter [Oscillospiraceae bacterium]
MLSVVLALAFPTMMEQLLQTAVQYIDTAMVGSLGTQATAAVGATTTVNWLIGSTVSALGVGFLAYISQASGAGEKENARKAVGQAVMIVLTVGIFFTILTVSLSNAVPVWMQVDENIQELSASYFRILYLPMLFRTANIVFGTILRAAGDTKTPMRVSAAMNLLNTALNFLLIYPTRQITIPIIPIIPESMQEISLTIVGAGLGIQGAATASAIAYTFGGIAMTVMLWRHPEISPRGQSIRPDLTVLKPCLQVAFPNMLQRFATSLGYVAFAAMINSLGETATAAHTIANTVESAFYIPGYGMQTAAATLSGNAWGARDQKQLQKLARTILPLEMILMIGSGGLLFLFAPELMRIFSEDTQVISLGTTVLRMVAISEPFYGVPIVIEGMMQGLGRTVAPFVYNVLGMWCIRIVGTFVCTQILDYGLISAWACMIAHNLLLFILFTGHYASGRWKPAEDPV